MIHAFAPKGKLRNMGSVKFGRAGSIFPNVTTKPNVPVPASQETEKLAEGAPGVLLAQRVTEGG